MGGAKYRIGATQTVKGHTNISGLNVWNITAHQHHAPARKALESPLHPGAKIALPLAHARKARRRKARMMIGRGGKNQFSPAHAPQTAQQPRQCEARKIQRRAIADHPRQAPLTHAQARNTGEHNNNRAAHRRYPLANFAALAPNRKRASRQKLTAARRNQPSRS